MADTLRVHRVYSEVFIGKDCNSSCQRKDIFKTSRSWQKSLVRMEKLQKPEPYCSQDC